MLTAKDYWEERFGLMDVESCDFSRSKPSNSLAGFCKKYLENDAVVLDLGCGGGRNAHYIAQKGYEVYGVDIAEEAVEFCRRRFALHNLTGIFKRGTFDHIPFPDNHFTGVICIAALDHVTLLTAQTAIMEIGRVLAPQGAILLTFDPPDTDDDLLDEAEVLDDGTLVFVRGEQNGMVFRRYEDEEIKRLLEERQIISFDYSDEGSRIIVCR